MQLFVREFESLDGVQAPRLSEAESRLDYSESTQIIRSSLGWTDLDPDSDRRVFISECVIPLDPPYVIRFSNAEYRNCYDAGTVIQHWRKSPESKDRPDVLAWLQEYGPELDQASRFYHASQMLDNIKSQERNLKELQDAIELMKINASISVLEVKSNRKFSQKERDIIIAEYGWKAEDFIYHGIDCLRSVSFSVPPLRTMPMQAV